MAFFSRDSSPHTLPRETFILNTHARASTLRSRKPHSKSRRGCIRCKQQRKKCDETRPTCKRCATRNHVCKWSEVESNGGDAGRKNRDGRAQTRDGFSFDHVLASTTGRSSSPLSSISTCSANAYEFHFSALAHDPQTGSFFSASELALLSHYLTHTSRVFSYDEIDSYVLQVGIPNLALGNKPLTSSLLALAAIDRCNQLTRYKTLSAADLDIVHSLLTLGDWHHRNALRLIQSFIPDSNSYDHVLANAPLMVLYGTASHCIRVRITRRFIQNAESTPSALQPLQSQWVLLIRAAYTAFMGVVNSFDECSPDDCEHHNAKARRVHAQRPEILAAGVTRAYSAEDGPTERTRCSLDPVMAMTHLQALERLQNWAHNLDLEQMHSMEAVDFLACLETLDILRDIFATVFSSRDPLSNCNKNGSLSSGMDPGKLSSHISPWLHSYVARVTYVTPSRPLRRIIMSFVNRVPSKYLTLVEAALEVMNAGSSPESDVPTQHHGGNHGNLDLGTMQALALDIFAHWLVLVMLLDGVWWIGNIGDWELERIIDFVRTHGILLPTASGTDWWPKYMYDTKRKLAY